MRTASAARSRIDPEALRALVTVAAFLRAAGYDVPHVGRRMACMLHGGGNSSSFSFTETVYRCHTCGAGGDVYALAMALFKVDFPGAIARVAQVAGVDVEGLPELDRTEIERRQTVARRRQALADWRRVALGEALTRQGNLDHEAFRIVDQLRKARDRGDELEVEVRLDILADIYAEMAAAEYRAARLTPEDERAWLAVWREQGGSTCDARP